jgi:hypothetical protein
MLVGNLHSSEMRDSTPLLNNTWCVKCCTILIERNFTNVTTLWNRTKIWVQLSLPTPGRNYIAIATYWMRLSTQPTKHSNPKWNWIITTKRSTPGSLIGSATSNPPTGCWHQTQTPIFPTSTSFPRFTKLLLEHDQLLEPSTQEPRESLVWYRMC